MYTLSKNSWHYRLVSFFGRVPDTINLCPYIRDVLACILISAVGVAIGVGFVAFNIIGVVNAFNGTWAQKGGLSLGAIANITTATTIFIFVIQLYLEKLRYRHYERKRQKAYDELHGNVQRKREPGFLKLWWRTVHDKVCSTIEFK
jgi:uncharacterized membrane protein